MNRAIALSLAVAVASCDTSPQPSVESKPSAQNTPDEPVDAPPLTTDRVASGTASGPFRLRFWVNEGAPSQSDDEGHPCGSVRELSISVIPDFPKTGPLSPANASEHSSSGTTVNSWDLPVDFVPVAIDGDSLLIEVPGAIDQPWEQYWISTDGAILRPQSRIASVAKPQTCSEDLGEYDLTCYPLKDPETRATRLIAAETLCS